MKSTRRHELQTNVLADSLGRFITRVKPYGRILGYGAAFVAALVFVLFVLPALRGAPTRDAVASAAFLRAVAGASVEPLRAFLDDHPDAPQSPAARIALGDRLYMRAVRGVDAAGNPVTKAQAQQDLAAAKNEFTRAIAGDPSCEPLARLMLALITVQEGGLEPGMKALQEVVDKWPQSEAAGSARLHLARLQAYKPVAFSDEPLEPPKKGEKKEGAKPAAPPAEPGAGAPEGGPAAATPAPTTPPGAAETKPKPQE